MRAQINKFLFCTIHIFCFSTSVYCQYNSKGEKTSNIPIYPTFQGNYMDKISKPIIGVYPSSIMFMKTTKKPLFCHLEYLCEKKSNIPVRFRLGNLYYVNKLEGKF